MDNTKKKAINSVAYCLLASGAKKSHAHTVANHILNVIWVDGVVAVKIRIGKRAIIDGFVCQLSMKVHIEYKNSNEVEIKDLSYSVNKNKTPWKVSVEYK